MKIAILGSRGYPYVYSGYETFVKEVCERLVKLDDVEITVYCHKNLFEVRPKEINGIKLKYIPTIKSKSLSQLVHSFQSFIHASFSNYDIVFAVNSANGPFGWIPRLFGKKTAINVDGLEWLRPKWKGLGAKYFYWSSKLCTKTFNKIVNDSDAMRDFYLKEFNTDSTVIAYGANIRESKNPKILQQWQLESQSYYLIVGRLIPDNNADVIVREFISSTSKKKLVIVGDVPYKDAYADRIKSVNDPRVVFTGYVKDQDLLAELYHNCYAYFHGHEFGGTNPTMLKALAYGCAILAIDTPFTQEMLSGNQHGFYFSKEEGNLRSLIEQVDNDNGHLEELRKSARNRIIENYTWEKITDQYYNFFKTLLK
ncbi:DUF1972 domain-containing protein [Ekhidna sp.]|uniref:DUF1972 domain-containing protein n=1 Tax=Ekhidna sp. TaxID=2608089 RepID=UPI003B58B4C6